MALGVDMVKVRWARGAFGVVENLTKNLFALFRFRSERLLIFVCGLALFTLLPLVACIAGRAMWWPMATMVRALFLAYGRTGKYHHFSAAQMLLLPVATVLLLYALCRSMLLALWHAGVSCAGPSIHCAELRGGTSKWS